MIDNLRLFLGHVLNSGGIIPLIHVVICLVSSLLVLLIPLLRSAKGYFLLAIASILLTYRDAVPSYLLINGIVFLFAWLLDKRVQNPQTKIRQRWSWCCAAMVLLILLFAFQHGFRLEERRIKILNRPWVLWSIDMWLLLRLITFLWEFGSGRVKHLSPFWYVVWCGLPLTSFGPVLRYSNFESQLVPSSPTEPGRILFSPAWWSKLALSLGQILLGVLAVFLHAQLEKMRPAPLHWPKVLLAFGTAPWSFYLSMAGYFNLMECLAPAWAIILPPSFNAPFGRANISEFWMNWNMSATSIFRDYLFYNRWGRRKINIYLNTLILFLMVGLWHGLNAYWGLWGLLHGIGFCVFLWYRQNLKRPWQERLAALKLPSNVEKLSGAVLTYVFVCACWALPSKLIQFLQF